MEPAELDMPMIEYLFEHRSKDGNGGKDKSGGLVTSGNLREIIVLDNKRSNAINIGMTKLPPPRIIKQAVMKMDSTIMNREGVEKLLTMLPTEEETLRIQVRLQKNFLNPFLLNSIRDCARSKLIS